MFSSNDLMKAKHFFNNGKTRDIEFRKKMLVKLQRSIRYHERDILNALKRDLNKAHFEGYVTEVGLVLDELSFALKHVARWSRAQRVPTPIVHFPASSCIYKDPYGVVLIMAPWNYPFQLAMAPLIGAIAAGNCAVVKPSEYAAHTAAVIEDIINECFSPRYIRVVRGGRAENKSLLELKFDYIFFTGSPVVGQIVMEAAAKHLTPVTLELGGKSPCIVDASANIDLAAKRIVWGKYLNAGQTCVAPDYVLADARIEGELVRKIKKYITKLYGPDPLHNDEYPRIINEKHFNRLVNLIKNEKAAIGGNFDADTLRIEPTVLNHISWDSPVMQEEIFGPVLPVLAFDHFKTAVDIVNERTRPLALYLFTTDERKERYTLNHVSFGGGCINDTVIHLSNHHLLFGGVGESGMGQYHGKGSFDTFSRPKSIIKKSNKLDIPLRYPPFKNHLALVKKIMK